jgi:hypothetical protein
VRCLGGRSLAPRQIGPHVWIRRQAPRRVRPAQEALGGELDRATRQIQNLETDLARTEARQETVAAELTQARVD